MNSELSPVERKHFRPCWLLWDSERVKQKLHCRASPIRSCLKQPLWVGGWEGEMQWTDEGVHWLGKQFNQLSGPPSCLMTVTSHIFLVLSLASMRNHLALPSPPSCPGNQVDKTKTDPTSSFLLPVGPSVSSYLLCGCLLETNRVNEAFWEHSQHSLPVMFVWTSWQRANGKWQQR